MKQLSAWIKHVQAILLILATWGSYLSFLFLRVIRLDQSGLWVGHPSVWSDWALHIGMANLFASKSPAEWFAYHPLYVEGKFTYPFLTNLVSGLLMRAGWSLPAAFIVPSILFVFLLLIGFYCLFYELFGSRKLPFIAISLFFLASGFGGIRFFHSPHLHEYTINNFSSFSTYEWYGGNFIDAMLLPQRAFLLGITVAVWSLVFLYRALKSPTLTWQTGLLLVLSGFLAGILPVTHVHSAIALIVIFSCIAIAEYKNWVKLSILCIVSLSVAFPLYWHFLHGGIASNRFFVPNLGWTAPGGVLSWLHQWWLQWGLMLPIVLFGTYLLWKNLPPASRSFFIGCWCLFILGNLFLFQPVKWDNTKLFLWSYLGFSGVAAWVIMWLWHQPKRIIAVVLTVMLTFTGALEITRLAWLSFHPYQLSTPGDITLGKAIQKETDTQARFLTSSKHNNPVMMWGVRPILLGYVPWVWNYGFDYAEREKDIAQMYSGTNESLALLKKYRISYVLIGPEERNSLKANEIFYDDNFPVIYESESYQIFDTRNLL